MNSKLFWSASLLALPVLAGPTKEIAQRKFAAPPAPPAIIEQQEPGRGPILHSAAAEYSIGDPTPEEQLYVEMINRARANPVAEAQLFATTTDPDVRAHYDFYSVDLALMQAQFAAIPAAPPVAPNAALIAAARRQTGDMLTNAYQGHVGSDGSTFDQRITQAGYTYSTIGENVYANAESIFHGHAGFDVDWGPGTGGMQTPPGHRNTIHNPAFREVGVGVLFGRKSPAQGSTIPGSREVGPQIVTQEFGTRRPSTPLITGVVYFDLNGNNFYDIGEGIGGVRVTADGVTATAISARSGGYALPVLGNGTYTLTFAADGLPATTRTATVAQAENVKLDLLPAYTPPSVGGPPQPAINAANAYQMTAVPAAAAYQWRSFELAAPAVEGAENAGAKVTIQKVGTYDVFESVTRKSGSYSFHLAHPPDGIREQAIVLNPSYVVGASSALRFASRLGWATENQTAKVQVSTNNGATWVDVYSQAGSGAAGESTFQDRSISLAEFAGATVQIRFSYFPLPNQLVFIDTDFETGWFIDDITLDNASEIAHEQVSDAAGRSFIFSPSALGSFVLQGRARTGHDFLPWGPALTVQSREGAVNPPELRLAGLRLNNGAVELDVDLVSGSAPGALSAETKTILGTPWIAATATVQTISSTRFRLSVPVGGSSSAFYRIKAD